MVVDVPVKAVLALCDPIKTSPWIGGRVTKAMILRHLKNGRMQPAPVMSDASSYKQAGRIAHLVDRGWNDPIQIDVGIPSMGCYVEWPVVDGNHRLAAASIREDEFIAAEISGSVRYAADLFGIDESQIK